MTKYLLLAATTLALAAPSFAQRPPQLTPEERKANFVKADADKNGKLNKDEFKVSLGERAAQMGDRIDQIFTGRDADKDGAISEAEYLAPMQRPGGGGGN
jgi:hypothetical protein